MNKKKNKVIINSFIEFKKKYFPKAYKEKILSDSDENPIKIGTNLADEFIDKLNKKLE